MDNIPGLSEKRGSSLTNGPSFRRPAGSPTSHLATTQLPAAFTTTITIHRDDRGYGMKVSGDNPVYVQSVKEGGAAERAGLHSGDTIVKVNGVNVLHLTHTEVVELIKAATEVVLTVQQNPVRRERAMTGAGNAISSPSLHRAASQPRDRITGPQPVDHEQKRQLEFQKTNTLKLMLEKEQMYVESLRSNLAKCKDPTSESNILQKLHRAEKSVQTLQQQLSELEGQEAPPLPSRNSTPPRPPPVSPPPLPPRQYLLHSHSTICAERAFAESTALGAVGKVPQSHHRTKSSPDSLSTDLLTEASKRLIASESMTELCFAKKSRGGVAWEVEPGPSRPPGTPPPPYMSDQQSPEEHNYCQIPEDDILPIINNATDLLDNSPNKTIGGFTIHSPTQVQQPIISMEDEDMSDQEMTQTENHGPFKSLSKLWSHQVHLAVFLNYVISNSDPSSLLFYLLTDLYKEGSAKEMKKWAYEIHSSFLVPTAPLRVSNVDENVAREIDDVLANESDKEEILRKVFWKARQKAKEELNEQLADFQSKRTAGMGTMYGPNDAELEECLHDKSKELKVIETILVPKFEPYLLDIERGDVDDKRFSTGAALGTVMGKVFGIRGTHFNSLLERCLTYVSKDKSLKARLIGKTRKVTKKGHHCIAHQYYTVTYCNHCQNIIWGIGPQGYQCTNCGLNIHRNCVTQLEEVCPGPMVKKEKAPDRIRNLMDRIRPENTRRKPSHSLPHEKSKRHLEEDSSTVLGDNESGDRTRSEKRPEPVRETGEESWRLSRQPSTEQHPDHPESNDVSHHHHHPQHNPPPQPQHVTKTKCNNASISRSESYKERIHQKRQLRERRKTSDPNLSKTNNDVEVDSQPFANLNKSHSGSSSNSSLSTSLESPSNSTEAVSGTVREPWDSDMDAEAVQPEWTTSIPEEVRESMSEDERKRQEIINELFHTEKSHVRGLKVLERVFYRPMKEREILSPDQLNLLFANLEEMVAVHSTFNTSMKAKRAESPIVGDIGHLLLHMFDGPAGERFQKAAAMFCAQQHNSLELLKEKRKKDQKFHNFLTEAEMNSVCRRLQLKDILPTGWQRLTKYPLLLENLVKYSAEVDVEEKERLQRALDRSKEVLNFVDSAVKEAENQTRLAEIQKRLDTGPFDKMDYPIVNEYRNLDLTKHRLLYEGPLNWRIQNRQKLLDLHVLLLEDAIILLQKQDEKFVLKFYSQALSPVIKVSTVLVRHNAVDKQALFLVNTSHNGAQIYDLRASCPLDKRKWFKHISDAAESYKTKDSKYKNREPPASDEVPDNLDKNKESEENETGGELAGASPSPGTTPQPPASPAPGSNQASPRLDKSDNESIRRTESGSGGGPELLAATYIEEGALVEPSQVLVCTRDVHTAQPVLTPLEKLRRKDEAVKQALYEKQILVADLLHVPREDFDTIADLAGETTAADKEPSELILAAVSQASALSLVVNEALRVSEEEAVNASVSPGHVPGVPAHRIQAIATALNSQLSHLLKIMNDRDEERERLRRELQKSREQLHALHERREPNGFPEQESCPEEPPSETSPALAPPPPSEVFVDALSEEVTTSLEANVEEEEDSASNKEP